MSRPVVRALTVLELLQAHHRITGAQIAERLEMDPRTVRRYIATLQEWGIPVVAERGRYGAYGLLPGFKLPPLMFSDEEALALTLGLLAARRMGLTLATPAIEGALAKVQRVLPAQLRDRVQAVEHALVLDVEPQTTAPAPATLYVFSAAVQQSRRVWLRYRSPQGAATERAVDPYGVVYRAGRWYVPGYCHLRDDLRVFRLDRVSTARLLEETFARPAEFDVAAYVQRSLAVAFGAWLVRARLDTTLATARRRVPPDQAMVEETPDGVELRVYGEDLDWVAHFLVSLEVPFTVLEPPEMREALLRLAGDLTRAAPPASAEPVADS